VRAEATLVAAFIDLVGGGYVEPALELGIATDRIDTIVDFPSIEKYRVKGDGGAAAASAATLAELAEAIAAGDLVVPIQRTYPLGDVRAALTELEAGSHRWEDRPDTQMMPREAYL
jgi:NADPH:quinone reductase-like Zn-dependent oxidoreductase